MFDTITGLPVHVLVVHAVVVLVPLMTLVTLAFTLRARWRSALGWAVLGNAAAFGAAFASAESGEALQGRLSGLTGDTVAAEHGDLGSSMPWFALALLVASVIAYVLLGRSRQPWSSSETWDAPRSEKPTHSPGIVALATVLVLVTGGAATVWTVRVGDSGARAAWEDTIANTKPAGR